MPTDDCGFLDDLRDTVVEYRGQVVGARVLRTRGPFLRVMMRVKDGGYFTAWVPRWKVLDRG